MAKKKADAPPADPQEARYNEMMTLIRRAENGDESAMKDLRAVYDEVPILWEQTGDMAAQVLRTLARRMAGKNLVVQESIQRKCKTMRAELAGANPTPLESLLADRIVVCWLTLQQAEFNYASADSMTLDQAAFAQKRISAAHNRYLTAIRTLAQVRRLAVPVVQVNVAQAGARQLNVATPGPVLGDAPGEDG